MKKYKLDTLTPKQFVELYLRYKSVKGVARYFTPHTKGQTPPCWHAVQKIYKKAVAEGLIDALNVGHKTNKEMKNSEVHIPKKRKGRVRAKRIKSISLPREGVRRFLFTCAQNNTHVFEPFWENLLVLKEHYEAELHVSRFVYITNAVASINDKFQAFERMARQQAGDKPKSPDPMWWDSKFEEFLSDDRLEVAPGLVWCGDMNILPTAVHPLSDLDVYTGRKSGIFPHAKLALKSVPSAKYAPTKFNYTTGAVTLRNYIQRKAGQKAEFHHCYAALLVEVDSAGDWFVRQINADSEGVIYDLDLKVAKGVLTKDNAVEAITWGDIHVAQIEPWVKEQCWGDQGILDTLRPKAQFFHDVLDFRARTHHDKKRPHRLFKRFLNGETNVREEAGNVAAFLEEAVRPWCENIVVHSNHHDHLGRWLEEEDGRFDPKNVEFWTVMQGRVLADIRAGSEVPNYFQLMMDEVNGPENIQVLNADQSFVICSNRAGGVECGMHGHSGPNGSRGSAKSLSRLGRKANIGHYHSAEIIDGVYVAGTCSRLAPDWTTGPSSWSHSLIVVYANGKRAILTQWHNKWRA